MKVAIIGASGKSGKLLVKECLEKGYQVVGVCRPVSVPKLDEFADRITIVPGLTSDREVIRQAVQGCAGVITIIVAPGRRSTYATDTVRNVLEEAKDARLVFSGSGGASQILEGETRSFRNRMEVALGGGIAWLFGLADISDMLASTELIYASDTRWTVVRGPWLKKGESQGMPVTGSLGDPVVSAQEVRRVDFAKFMVAALEDDSLVRKALSFAKTWSGANRTGHRAVSFTMTLPRRQKCVDVFGNCLCNEHDCRRSETVVSHRSAEGS